MYLIDIDTNTYCSCSFIDFIHVALRWVYSSRYMYTCVYYAYYWGAGTASPGGSGLLRVTWAEPLLIRFSRNKKNSRTKREEKTVPVQPTHRILQSSPAQTRSSSAWMLLEARSPFHPDLFCRPRREVLPAGWSARQRGDGGSLRAVSRLALGGWRCA